jgi:methionyl aminopeptidase
MSIESEKDVIALKRVGNVVHEAIHSMFASMEARMTTMDLEMIGAEVLKNHGARSAPKVCYDYPYASMISVNEEVAHGQPNSRVLRDGDLVNIDVSAELDGYFADSGYSMPVGEGNAQANQLCRAGKKALQAAMDVAKHGKRIRDVELAVRKVAQQYGYSIIENLVGHGTGRHLHEEPANVPSWGDRRDKRRFVEGSVLTLEPFLSTGPKFAHETGVGWTMATRPGNFTVQFEHTIIITRDTPIILTAA